MKTHLSTAGEGFELNSPDAKIIVKVDAAHTDGAFELFEVDAPRGPTVPPRSTPWATAFYVLHGRMAVLVDGEAYDVGRVRRSPSRRARRTRSPCTRRR